jgi:hypothetical protein
MTGKMALLLPDAFRDRVVALVRASHPEDRDVAP